MDYDGDDFMVSVTASLKVGLASLERWVRNVFTSFLLLFALVVHVTMVILKILFIYILTHINECYMRMQLNKYGIGVIFYNKNGVSVHWGGNSKISGNQTCAFHTWRTCHRTGRGMADLRPLPPRHRWPCRGHNSRRASVRGMPRLCWRARKAPRTALLGHHHHLTEREVDIENFKAYIWSICS